MPTTTFQGLPLLQSLLGGSDDVDAAIDQVLFRAANPGELDRRWNPISLSAANSANPGCAPRGFGRATRPAGAILENVVGLLRGEANGVLFSQWDADPQLSVRTAVDLRQRRQLAPRRPESADARSRFPSIRTVFKRKAAPSH